MLTNTSKIWNLIIYIQQLQNPDIKDEKEELRKEIRRRLIEQMAKEGHERLQMTTETVIPSPALIKRNVDTRRRSDPTTVVATPTRNEPLFKLNIRVQDGNPVEQIVHAVFFFFPESCLQIHSDLYVLI